MHLDPRYQVLLLIEAKADVNQAKTSDGSTPLYWAASNGHADVVSRPLSIDTSTDLLGLTVSSPYTLGSTLPGGGADRGQS
jgi:ankyrin repeat protein